MKRSTKIALAYAAILLYMFSPMIPVLIASAIASYLGVPLDEGSAHPSIVFGYDIGGILYSMGVMGWFTLLTFPTGGLVLLIFTFASIAEGVQKRFEKPTSYPKRGG